MRRLTLAVLFVVIGVVPAAAQVPLPPVRSCQEDRDHLRVLIKLVADGRGSAEWGLAEALAKQQRLEAEVKQLRDELTALKKPLAPKEETK